VRKVLAFLLPAMLFLTACGGASTPADFEDGKSAGASEILESVEVDDAGPDTAPKVEFDAPLDITATAVRTVVKGDGEVIEAGQNLTFHLVFLNADDGSVLQDSYEAGQAQPLSLNDQLKELDPELYEVLVGNTIGSQIAYTRPLEAQEGAEAPPNQLLVLQVISAEDPPKKLSSEEVAELEEAGQLPTVTLDGEGVPSIEFPENEAPADLVVKVIEEGTGEEITEADTIAANYTGWSWQGEQFDSSFERGEPTEFPLNGVIPGWTQGLSGLKAGSKVLLVIPSEMAYGDQPQQGPAGPLAFYVEIVEKVAAE
jgi:hypothetical protein